MSVALFRVVLMVLVVPALISLVAHAVVGGGSGEVMLLQVLALAVMVTFLSVMVVVVMVAVVMDFMLTVVN